MIERLNRPYGSMRNAKQIKFQIEDSTLIFLEKRSMLRHSTQVGYGRAIADLCRDFQTLSQERRRLLEDYTRLLAHHRNLCPMCNLPPNVAKPAEPV